VYGNALEVCDLATILLYDNIDEGLIHAVIVTLDVRSNEDESGAST
jgi:hypothetical protein